MAIRFHTYRSVARSLADGLASGEIELSGKTIKDPIDGSLERRAGRIIHWRSIATASLSLCAAFLILPGLERATLTGIGALIAISLSVLLNVADIFDFRRADMPGGRR